jgi:hypothetical protein
VSGETWRKCKGCGRELTGRAVDATTHGGACRQRAYRQRLRLQNPARPELDAEVLVRHDRAMKYVGSVNDLDQRRDVLYAVVWPQEWRTAVGL